MGYRGGSRGRGRKGRGGGGSRRDRPVHEPEYIENRDGSSSSVGDESDTSSSSGEAFGTSTQVLISRIMIIRILYGCRCSPSKRWTIR